LFWLIIKLLKVLLLISSGSKQPRVQTSVVNIHNRFFWHSNNLRTALKEIELWT
jgi:hypothetical protein